MKLKIPEPKGTWDFIILIWSAFVVFAILFEACSPRDAEVSKLLDFGDTAACGFFFADVMWRWLAADNKIGFWKWGWIDLNASIPTLESMRWARMFRVFRIFRIVRGMRSAARVASYFFRSRTRAAVVISVTMLFGSLLISSILVLDAEKDAGPIKTIPDAFWWAIETVTTVGYGDITPVTHAGKIIGIGLMVVGISLFSAASGLLASWLIKSVAPRDSDDKIKMLEESLKRIENAVDKMRDKD